MSYSVIDGLVYIISRYSKTFVR